MSQMIQVQEERGFMEFTSISQAMKYAEIISKSKLCPKDYINRPEDILVAIQTGLELRLKPMQALRNISVINGRASVWGDAMLALCRTGADFEYCHETYDEATQTAHCKVKRKGEPEYETTFSVEDAKRAGLWGKQGPWTQYPKRMLQVRARGFALRDKFPHLLMGLISAEEAGDYHDKQPMNVVPHAPKPVDTQSLVEEDICSPDTFLRLMELCEQKGVTEETVKAWKAKAKITELEQLKESQAQKLIDMLEKTDVSV